MLASATAVGTAATFLMTGSAYAQFAQTDLSNLTPTSINQDLVPNANDTFSLGSDSLRWKDLFLSGKLGIGTGTPDALFEVRGSSGDFAGLPAASVTSSPDDASWVSVLRNVANVNDGFLGVYMATSTPGADIGGISNFVTCVEGNCAPSFTIYPRSGNVVIGPDSYPSKLDVVPNLDGDIEGTTNANASTSIVGSGTKFSSAIGIGDRIALSSAPSTYATVTAVTDDTHLTVSAALGNGTSQTIALKQGIVKFSTSTGDSRLFMNDLGNVGIGDHALIPGAKLEVTGSGAGDFGGFPALQANIQNDQNTWTQVFQNRTAGLDKLFGFFMNDEGAFNLLNASELLMAWDSSTIYAGKQMVLSQGFTSAGHLASTAPAATSGSGTCTAVTVSGTDTRGTITASCTAGQTAIVTFGTAYGTAPKCTFSADNSRAVMGAAYATKSTTALTLTSMLSTFGSASWDYLCME
jgi:hypothetical protein